MKELTDRIKYAAELCRGKKVLDIGGQKMPDCDPESPFAREYAKIETAAAEYQIVDYQDREEVDYVMDLNKRDSIEQLRQAIDAYQPEVVLCTETLEHINYHFEVMNEMARAIAEYHATVFITVPNNGNWVFNALGWNHDHSIGFFRDIAKRFVDRSDLGQHDVQLHYCMQQYIWYWWIPYLLAFCQPFSWGFTIKPKGGTTPGAGTPA